MDHPSIDFFAFPTWRDFLRERFRTLKAAQPRFSARAFARRAGIGSPSYFQLVVDGERQLSTEYAERFAAGLGLDAYLTRCLVTSVALEGAASGKRRDQLAKALSDLRRRSETGRKMLPSHVKILSDPLTLKIYLLAQSKVFKLAPAWIRRELPATTSDQGVEERIELLLASGLWVREGAKVRTMAPTVRTGDLLAGSDLKTMHKNLLAAAAAALDTQGAERRVAGSRTFLCDPKVMAGVQEKIEAFKQDLEASFENLAGTAVYQLHVSFFELEPKA